MIAKKTFWIIVGVVGLLCFLGAVQGILLPFALAFILAYLLNPLVTHLSKMMGRPLATGLVVGAVVLLVIFALFCLIPVLQAQITSFIGRVPMMAEKAWSYIKSLILWGRPEISYQEIYRLSNTTNQAMVSVLNAFGSGLNHVISGGLAVVNVLALVFISPIVLFYVLKDIPKMKKNAHELVPQASQNRVKELVGELDKTLSGFLRGQASVCCLLALYYTVALTLVGLDLGAVIGLMTGILTFIPYVGFFIGLLVSLVIVLIQGGGWALLGWVVGVYFVGNILEGYILTPNLVGRKVGLHPAWILFALLAGGSLFGFLGVLVAVPVAAIIGVLVRHLIQLYQSSSFYKGRE